MTELVEKLIHKRFTKQELIRTLLDISNTFEISENNDREPEQDLRFDIADSEGFGEIWYILTPEGKIYVTEVYYERG